jgi:hypothetical protein
MSDAPTPTPSAPESSYPFLERHEQHKELLDAETLKTKMDAAKAAPEPTLDGIKKELATQNFPADKLEAEAKRQLEHTKILRTAEDGTKALTALNELERKVFGKAEAKLATWGDAFKGAAKGEMFKNLNGEHGAALKTAAYDHLGQIKKTAAGFTGNITSKTVSGIAAGAIGGTGIVYFGCALLKDGAKVIGIIPEKVNEQGQAENTGLGSIVFDAAGLGVSALIARAGGGKYATGTFAKG